MPSTQIGQTGCINCDKKCTSCVSGNICESCIDFNAEVINNNCTCKTGYQGVPTTQIGMTGCVLCDEKCSKCVIDDICEGCIDENAELSPEKTCVCKSGYSNTPSSNSLIPGCVVDCNQTCSKCDAISCPKCIDPFAFRTGIDCICSPNSKSIPPLNITIAGCEKKCPVGCSSCVEPFICSGCIDTNSTLIDGYCVCKKGLIMAPNGICYSNICKGFSADIQLCGMCILLGAIPLNGKCTCQSNFYVDGNITNENPCMQCFNECSTCKVKETCLSCKSDHASPNGTFGCKCDEGYFNTTQLLNKDACIKCNPKCLSCENDWSCSECIGNNTYLSSGRCICKRGFYYPNPASVDCIPCRTDSRGYCNYTCEEKQAFYLGDCVDCHSNCDSCNTELKCTKCANKESPVDGICECPKGRTMDKGKCKKKLFKMSLEVTTKNEIFLRFQEIPEIKLEQSMIKIETTENLDFQIYAIQKYLYKIKLDKRITSSKRKNFTLTIQENPIYSIKGSELKKYLYYSDFNQKNTSQFNQKVSTAMAVAAGAAFATAVVSNPASCWILLNTIQLITYFPLCSIDFSEDMLGFFQGIGSYNAMPAYVKSSISTTSSKAPNERIQRIGIHSSVFIANFGKNALVLFVYIALVPIIFAGLILKPLRQRCIKMLQNYKFSVFIRFFIQTYLDIVLFSVIQILSVTPK